MSDFIDHPQYAKISAFTTDIVSQIAVLQEDFFAIHGYYFQGLWLLGDTQVDGTVDTTIDNTTSPSDQPFTWEDFDSQLFKNNTKIPVNVSINVYETPTGEWGWILYAEVFYAGLDPDAYGNYGDHWVYMHHHGPEDRNLILDQWFIDVEEFL